MYSRVDFYLSVEIANSKTYFTRYGAIYNIFFLRSVIGKEKKNCVIVSAFLEKRGFHLKLLF